jgi:hypothetical protein
LKATQEAADATRREVVADLALSDKSEEAIEDDEEISPKPNGGAAKAKKAIKEKAMNGVKKAGERGRKLVKDAVVEGEMHLESNGSIPDGEGLSTTDPHAEGVSYADKAKK